MPRLNKQDYPLVLEPVDIQKILNMGQRQTYELVKDAWKHKAPFQVVRPGRDYKIPRDPFFQWLEGSEYQESTTESDLQSITTQEGGKEMQDDAEMKRKMRETRLREYKNRMYSLEMDLAALKAIDDKEGLSKTGKALEDVKKAHAAVEGMK